MLITALFINKFKLSVCRHTETANSYKQSGRAMKVVRGSEGKQKRILLIANKSWEVWPLTAVLMEEKAVTPGFPWPIGNLKEWQNYPTKKIASNINSPE